MGVGVASKDGSEEWRAGGEDDFVSLYLLIIAGKGHVKKVLVFSQLSEGDTDVAFKVVPPQTKLFCTPHFNLLSLTLVSLSSQLFCSCSELLCLRTALNTIS